jgi:hypothetical protein
MLPDPDECAPGGAKLGAEACSATELACEELEAWPSAEMAVCFPQVVSTNCARRHATRLWGTSPTVRNTLQYAARLFGLAGVGACGCEWLPKMGPFLKASTCPSLVMERKKSTLALASPSDIHSLESRHMFYRVFGDSSVSQFDISACGGHRQYRNMTPKGLGGIERTNEKAM